jgi:drug/metabolite transporter (DMT)-like permease
MMDHLASDGYWRSVSSSISQGMDDAAAVSSAEREPMPAHLPLVQLALAILTISLTPVLFRLSEINPTATAFYRSTLALPLVALWAAIERRRTPRGRDLSVRRRDGVLLAAAGLLFAGNIINYAWAVHLTSVANASLLSNSSPIFVSLGSFLVFHERFSRGFIAAMLAAIVGLVILAGDKFALGSEDLFGDGLGLLSALFFAAYLVIVGRLRLRVGSATIMLWTGIFTALALLAAVLATGQSFLPATWRGWAVLLALAVLSYTLGQGLLTVALARLSATFSAVALLCLPVSAALLGWALLGEALSLNQGIGGVIILASILAARLTSR